MTLSVRVRPRAERDIDEIAAYIARDSTAAAQRFLSGMRTVFVTLSQFPGIGISWLAPGLPVANLRSIPVRRYPSIQVYYTYDSNGITIIRVLHAARDADSILKDEDA